LKKFTFLDDLHDGYESLRNLVMTYLGLNQEQKADSTRPKTSDEIRRLEETFSKELDLPRSGKLQKKIFKIFQNILFFKNTKKKTTPILFFLFLSNKNINRNRKI
jgi:hypothetical protein